MARNGKKNGATAKGSKGKGGKLSTNGTNGAAKAKPEGVVDATKTTSKSLSTTTLFACGLVALLSFGAGVFTPPLLSYVNHQDGSGRKLSTASTSRSTVPEIDGCDDLLDQYLHDEVQTGMDVICVSKNWTLSLYQGASWARPPMQASMDLAQGELWPTLRDTLHNSLNLGSRRPINQAWALFTRGGERIGDEETELMDDNELREVVSSSRLLVVMGGGQWLWPGVRIGFKRTVDLSYLPGTNKTLEKRSAILETLSLYPLVVAVEGFLAPEECDHIQDRAGPSLRYSEVTLQDKDKGRPSSDFRTSQSTFLKSRKDPTLTGIDERTAALVRMPVSHQEQVQVLRYGYTEKYSAHMDYFNPSTYKNDKHTLRLIENGKKNRQATVFWYLTTVESGGHTVFPRFGKAPQPSDFNDCTKGLLVKPERGKVIIFYSMTFAGALDVFSLHGACPVKEGVKWAANKWVWNKPMKWQ
mmetsp:Transcript_11147/g.16264  ORF Transcript_11147/g.16264 Transcript_11147/m.16264 type:complete len:471 (-) Transcript_11147:69-1481(-)